MQAPHSRQAAGRIADLYDSDYERLADTAKITQEWIIPRGAGHGGGGR